MEPIIYKPSIYKGAGIYKTGAEGGGGDIDEIDGKKYKTALMPDGKIWLAENLDFKFCNIAGSGSVSYAAARYYDNDETLYGWEGLKCGLMYNWYAANLLNTNRSELCPGWHVPTLSEWNALITSIGGASDAGQKLKAVDGSAGNNWPSGWNGNDTYKLKILPGGHYWYETGFEDIGTYATFWSADSKNSTEAYGFHFDTTSYLSSDDGIKIGARSLRLVRD